MTNTRFVELEPLIPRINKSILYTISWGAKQAKSNKDEIYLELDMAFTRVKNYLLNTELKGIVYWDEFAVDVAEDCLSFKDHEVNWCFPRLNDRCIADSARETGRISLQVVTLGPKVLDEYEKLEREGLYSLAYYFHGFTTWLTEALADEQHDHIRQIWKENAKKERYSFGYSLCPELSMQKDLFKLLNLDEKSEVTLTSNDMMMPEQSTSAVVFH